MNLKQAKALKQRYDANLEKCSQHPGAIPPRPNKEMMRTLEAAETKKTQPPMTITMPDLLRRVSELHAYVQTNYSQIDTEAAEYILEGLGKAKYKLQGQNQQWQALQAKVEKSFVEGLKKLRKQKKKKPQTKTKRGLKKKSKTENKRKKGRPVGERIALRESRSDPYKNLY